MAKKTLKKGFPGVLPLEGDFLFIDETEISNFQYKEFLNWLKVNDTAQYKLMLPDTQVWRSPLAYNEPFVDYYFQHPAYQDYPLVGITYKQAQAFCQWRTDRVLEYLRKIKSPIKKLVYRLPSEKEWKKAAWGTLPEGSIWPWEGAGVRWKVGKKSQVGRIRFNFKRGLPFQIGIQSYLNDAGFITTPVFSYWPNTIGLYNMCGNVAEWTEEHKAMGGSWNDFGYQCQITTPKPVLHDSIRLSTLGFRCVMEILEYTDEYKIKPLTLTAKQIEKQMKLIPDTGSKKLLFASEFETTNGMYHTFLKEKEGHAIKNENWNNYTRYAAQQLYGWHQTYALYPVVNIEYEDAIAYCQWLTDKYNNLPKRKYKQVVFRLPTLQEWERAAKGGREDDYPWGGPYTLNSKGMYLANFSPLEDQYYAGFDSSIYFESGKVYRIEKVDTYLVKNIIEPLTLNYIDNKGFESLHFGIAYTYPNNDHTISRGVDGSYYPARVNAYTQNGYGIYTMAGNVSEMLIDKGKAKGGNWTSSQYQILNNSPAETYTAGSPTLGFRVFMEVVVE